MVLLVVVAFEMVNFQDDEARVEETVKAFPDTPRYFPAREDGVEVTTAMPLMVIEVEALIVPDALTLFTAINGADVNTRLPELDDMVAKLVLVAVTFPDKLFKVFTQLTAPPSIKSPAAAHGELVAPPS